MAAGNFTLYTAAVLAIGQAAVSLGTDNFNVILLTSAYAPNVNADATYSAISANEVAAGSGYAQGGIALTGTSWTQNGATTTFAAQSAVWTGASFSARYAAIVRRGGTSLAANDKLLGYVDLTGGGNASPSNSTFAINWNNASTPSSANTIFTSVHNP